MSEPHWDSQDSATAHVFYLGNKIDRISFLVYKLRHAEKPTPKYTIDWYNAMQAEVFGQYIPALMTIQTLNQPYSVLHNLCCVQQYHKDFFIQLQCSRLPPQSPPESLQLHKARQHQHHIILEPLQNAMSRHIGQRLDLLYFIVITKNCMAYALYS